MNLSFQIAAARILLVLFPISTYASAPSERERSMKELHDQVMQNTVHFYNAHRQATPELLDAIDQEFVSQAAHKNFRGVASTLENTLLPEASLTPEGKFRLEDNLGSFDFKELDNGEFEVEINNQKIKASQDEIMDQVVEAMANSSNRAAITSNVQIISAKTQPPSHLNLKNLFLPNAHADESTDEPLSFGEDELFGSYQESQEKFRNSRNAKNLKKSDAEAASTISMADDPIIFKTLPKALQELRTSPIKKTADGRFSILKRLKKTPFNDHIAVKSVQATAKLALVVASNIAFGIYNTIDDAAMKSQLRRCQDQRNKKFGISCFGRAKHSRLSQLLSYMDRNLAQVLGKIEAQGCNNVWNRLWTHFRPDSRCATLKELARCKQAVGEKVESK